MVNLKNKVVNALNSKKKVKIVKVFEMNMFIMQPKHELSTCFGWISYIGVWNAFSRVIARWKDTIFKNIMK